MKKYIHKILITILIFIIFYITYYDYNRENISDITNINDFTNNNIDINNSTDINQIPNENIRISYVPAGPMGPRGPPGPIFKLNLDKPVYISTSDKYGYNNNQKSTYMLGTNTNQFIQINEI